MKNFKVSLVKSYIITIEAENAGDAGELSEFFTGDIYDLSDDDQKREHKFKILDIEPAFSQAMEVSEIQDN